jgi:hypothetical protein
VATGPPSFAFGALPFSPVANLINNPRVALALALVVGAIVGWGTSVALAANASPASPASLSGLAAPRGLTATSDGSLLIAEGGAGRLLRWDLTGEPEVLSHGFPYLLVSGIEGESASGVSAALEIDDESYYVIVGEAREKGHQELYRLTPPDAPRPVTGQDVQGFSPPPPLTNPYDLVLMPGGDVLVTDSGRNNIWRITPNGEVAEYALLPEVSVPSTTGGSETAQAVPTGAVWGPDGALYVTTLTGWPHPAGAATVYRIADANADGDALDDDEVTAYATGFSAATDLAFDADGSLLVTEFSTQMQELVSDLTLENAVKLPGRLVRRAADGTTTVVAENLVGPTSVALVGDRIFVSEEFAGRVSEVGPARDAGLGTGGWLLSLGAGLASALALSGAYWRFQARIKSGRNPT